MLFRKKSDPKADPAAKPASSAKAAPAAPGGGGTKISVRPTAKEERPIRRSFPGPRNAQAVLRVTAERSAYAELIAHAKESLDAEVCGVLVGQVCEDDEGPFVHLEAVIRGAAASQGSTHVTFTQATWNAIHESLERDHPKRRMVGWYHTHPGFGVEFSEMDLFIQRNFFPGPTQIALVTDPLSGAVAICANTAEGIDYLPRFWVDGREQPCRVPERVVAASQAPAATTGGSPAAGAAGTTTRGDTAPALQALEERVSQLVHAVNEQRASFYRFLTVVGVTFCLGIAVVVAYLIWSQLTARSEPPKLNSYVPIPVQIGNRTVLIGLGVVEWQVPPELNAVYLQLEQMKQKADEKAAQEAAKTNASPAAPKPAAKP